MGETKPELIERFFAALGRGELDEALAMTTEDVVLDLSNSNAPWRGVNVGHEAIRAAYGEFREPIVDIELRSTEIRALAPDLLVLATELSMRGQSSGITGLARGGWLVGFTGGRIAEAVLHQTFEEALLAARRRLLAAARLYFVCEAQPDGRDPGELLAAAIEGGVDVIQMREKAPRCAEELIAFADPFARAAREHGALFFLNDEPGLVEACGADGVHVGQDDEPVAAARAMAGPAALVGLSTHSPEQFDAAIGANGAARPDQISAGPVWATPTKPGRPAAGLELIAHAARAGGDSPWFAIGGIDLRSIGEVAAAGARRAVVVRAIRDAADPRAAAAELRAALDPAAVVDV